VLVTPYVVRAVAQKDLSRPDDGFADPSDPAQVLLGHLNRIYGVGGAGGSPDLPDSYHGPLRIHPRLKPVSGDDRCTPFAQ